MKLNNKICVRRRVIFITRFSRQKLYTRFYIPCLMFSLSTDGNIINTNDLLNYARMLYMYACAKKSLDLRQSTRHFSLIFWLLLARLSWQLTGSQTNPAAWLSSPISCFQTWRMLLHWSLRSVMWIFPASLKWKNQTAFSDYIKSN